ncbi:MAG: uroporphyrinogen decarboxylase family protein [Candidatus Limivivens sp.]|nr:uroporphyrinogen decarboxylase family protein [Candidatus Limivivens sp.]
MTSRERLLCVLNGGIPDQVPVSPFIQEEYLSYYYNKKNTDRLYDAVALRKELDFDLVTRQYVNEIPYFLQRSFPNWEVERKVEVIKGNYIRTMTVKTPERTLKQVEGAPYNEKILSGIHFSTMEYLIKDSDDFEVFKKYCPRREKQDIDHILESGRAARKEIGDLGVSCPWAMGGVYNLASTYMNVQEMLVEALTDEDYYADYMSFFADLVATDHEIFVESEFDCVGMQGNIANGGMVGSDYFEEHILPYERKAIDVLRAGNKPIIYHNCGKAVSLYPAYKKLGITVWETISEAPQGDNKLEEAKKFFGDELILFGNFDQVHFLKEATPEEIEKAAYERMLIGKEGGHYIFACSDYLEIGTPLENVKAMLRGARAASKY